MADFNRKNILVVGGSSGIGLSVSKSLQKQGGYVIIASRNKPDDVSVQDAGHIQCDILEFSGKLDEVPEHCIVWYIVPAL